MVVHGLRRVSALLNFAPLESRAGDTQMLMTWRRTFHGPYALKTPLRGYLMPRRPNWDGWGGQTAACDDSCQTAFGFESAGFERLGRIPNELDLSLRALPPKP